MPRKYLPTQSQGKVQTWMGLVTGQTGVSDETSISILYNYSILLGNPLPTDPLCKSISVWHSNLPPEIYSNHRNYTGI